MINYRGVLLNEPGDREPWGPIEIQAFKDLIDYIMDGNISMQFKQLSDTPSDYTGKAGRVAAVNSIENALEFINVVRTIVGGDGIGVDSSDPLNPIISIVGSIFEEYGTYPITASGTEFTPFKTALADASGGQIELILPLVEEGDLQWYGVNLCCNTNHCGISTTGGQKINVTEEHLSLATVNATVIIKANGVDGYDLIWDTRVYKRASQITEDTEFLSGFEAGATYECKPADGEEITITILDWSLEHKGQEAAFVKTGGINSKVIITNQAGTFVNEIVEDDKQLTIYTGIERYSLAQDSRSGEIATQFDLLTRVIPSTVDPTARVFQVDNFDELDIESVVITSIDDQNPSVLSRFIDDGNAVSGPSGERSINGVGRFKVGGQTDLIQIKYRYSAINKDTLVVTPLSDSGWSAPFNNTVTFADYLLEGSIPEYEFHDGTVSGTGELFQAEILAIKASAAKSPTLQVRTGGQTPSKAIVGSTGSNLAHPTLKQVHTAKTGEKQGHVDNSAPLQIPELTTVERDAVASPNAGMIIWNTTKGVREQYNGTSWEEMGGTAPMTWTQLGTSGVYYGKRNGIVYFRGGNSSSSTSVGTLPVGYRPANQYAEIINASVGVTQIIINPTTGAVTDTTGDTVGATFGLISFPAEQ